jgi:chitodextrinase
VGTSAVTTAIFSGLVCNTSYTLAVDAYDSAGNNSAPAVVMVSTTGCPDTTPPSAPSGLAASNVTQTGLTLTWNASNDNVGVMAYDVYRNGTKIATVTTTSTAPTGLACGTSYTFGVVARDAAGNSSPQSSLQAVTTSCTPSSIPPATARDLAYWPFTSTSPWNYPIGSGALYAPETSPLYNAASGGVSINANNGYSIPVYVARSSDPLVNVYQGATFIVQMRVPTSATPAQGSDGHMAVINDTHSFVLETFGGITRQSNGNITAPIAMTNDLRGPGVYSGWHGTRAYGGSSIGGLIRAGELANGIPHALAASVQRASMNKNTPNGAGYVWPASSADSGWQTSYGSSGNVHMGSLLAIPANVDVTRLGLNAKALQLARAMQDYGVYIVDASSASDGIIFYAEPSTGSELDSETRAGLATAAHYLQVVTNNRSDNVGGGGTPRRPPAP